MEDFAELFLKLCRADSEMKTKIKTLETDKQRILHVINLCKKLQIKPPESKMQKSEKNSVECRIKGNELYKSGQDQLFQALESYSKSVAFSPAGSELLSISYANRSAVLFKLEKFEECLEDIKRSFELNYPDNLKFKVLQRKLDCFVALGKKSEAKQSYEETLIWIDEQVTEEKRGSMKNTLKKSYEKKIKPEPKEPELNFDSAFDQFEFKKANPEIPVASDAVELKYNEKYGKHVVATRDIRAGEVLVKEPPYETNLLYAKIFVNCSECLRFTFNGIPCDHCCCAIYCSDECKEKSWKNSHDLECKVLPYMINKSVHSSTNFSFKTLNHLQGPIKAVKEAGSIGKLMEELKSVDECQDQRTKGFSEDNKFHSDQYKTVYSLKTHIDEESELIVMMDLMIALSSAYYLVIESSFFGKNLAPDWKTLANDEDFVSFCCLVFKHLQIRRINGYIVLRESLTEPPVDIGSTLTSFHSYFNHSCSSNAYTLYRKGFLIISAIYPIKKGEQIFINYGVCYSYMPISERRAELKKEFHFNCRCIPCKENWPLMDQMQFYRQHMIIVKKFEQAKDKATFLNKLSGSMEFIKPVHGSFLEYESHTTAMAQIFNHFYDIKRKPMLAP